MKMYIVRESAKNANPETIGYAVATFSNYEDAAEFLEKSENRQNLYISIKDVL